jgi:hypothetical protein
MDGSNSTLSLQLLEANRRLYPDIGLAMLREEQTAAGRLWLLLTGLDEEGWRRVRVARIRHQFTKKSSANYLCTWPQLRHLLRDGEGLYRERDEERVWLRSAAKVAFGSGMVPLTGRPVALLAAALLDGIGRFRAELYAAFHSSRVNPAPDGQSLVAPIARETLTALSGVGRRRNGATRSSLAGQKRPLRSNPTTPLGIEPVKVN